jgi:phosphohistidine phosphatase
MELYLMQHGVALSKEADPERPLSPSGADQVAASAAAMATLGISLDLIASSPKLRARQTATIMAKALGHPVSDVVESDHLLATKPVEQALSFLKMHERAERVFFAGHLPQLGRIASTLTGGGANGHIGFVNAGLARIDIPSLPTTEGTLRWLLPPRLLARIG